MEKIWELFKDVLAYTFLLAATLILIFGGEFSIKINFKSIKDLFI